MPTRALSRTYSNITSYIWDKSSSRHGLTASIMEKTIEDTADRSKAKNWHAFYVVRRVDRLDTALA